MENTRKFDIQIDEWNRAFLSIFSTDFVIEEANHPIPFMDNNLTERIYDGQRNGTSVKYFE